MKLLFLLPVAATAFMPASRPSLSSALAATNTARPDASQAIQNALEASKEFGATSKEARVAWDIVEEMDASDNSAASQKSLDEECDLTDEERTKVCMEYEAKKQELAETLEKVTASTKPSLEKLRELALELKAVPLPDSTAAPSAPSPELKAALQAAQAAQDEFGASSKEAMMAWETVEEIGSADNSGAYGVRLDEQCLVESASEACQALEELNRVLNIN